MRLRMPLVVGVVLVAGLIAVSVVVASRIWADQDVFLRGPVAGAVAAGGVLILLAMVAFGLVRWRISRSYRKGLDEAESQAQQERRRFLLRLDHELKNPVQAIRAGLANLEGGDLPSDAANLIRSTDAQAIRVGRLVGDLRKLAELETQPLEETEVDVGELLSELEGLAGPERTIKIVTPQAPWPLPPVWGDRDLLSLAIHNLASNALKFSNEGDTIEARASEEEGDVVSIEIADTGRGIPSDEVSKVWEELVRGSHSQGVPGTGLGLAMVRVIAERHGGRTLLKSQEGAGTVVRLELPALRSSSRG
ncbi:MAG: sensor histidine kinase [Acidimicrobiia bacterium]|nr:sensor histidine kinase [Acidimicrobiia bacterium]